MGPMTAANMFLDLILSPDWPRPSGAKVAAIKASLHGSLAYTGIGHGSDRAVILGLTGATADTIDPDKMDEIVKEVERSGTVTPPGHPTYHFQPREDLVLDKKTPLPGHANGILFQAFDSAGRLLLRQVYYSIGGGFVVTDLELEKMRNAKKAESLRVPYPFATAKQMLDMAARSGLTIAQMKRANEEVSMSREQLDARLDRIWEAMKNCIDRGLAVEARGAQHHLAAAGVAHDVGGQLGGGDGDVAGRGLAGPHRGGHGAGAPAHLADVRGVFHGEAQLHVTSSA